MLYGVCLSININYRYKFDEKYTPWLSVMVAEVMKSRSQPYEADSWRAVFARDESKFVLSLRQDGTSK